MGRHQCVFVRRYQRPLAEDNPQAIPELAFDLFEFGIIRAAGRALKVGKFFHGYRRVGIAADMRWFGARRVGHGSGRRVAHRVLGLPRSQQQPRRRDRRN